MNKAYYMRWNGSNYFFADEMKRRLFIVKNVQGGGYDTANCSMNVFDMNEMEFVNGYLMHPEMSNAQEITYDDKKEMLYDSISETCDSYIGCVWNEKTARLLANDIKDVVKEFADELLRSGIEGVHDDLAEVKAMVATLLERNE